MRKYIDFAGWQKYRQKFLPYPDRVVVTVEFKFLAMTVHTFDVKLK